jgi:hypothetical protein
MRMMLVMVSSSVAEPASFALTDAILLLPEPLEERQRVEILA